MDFAVISDDKGWRLGAFEKAPLPGRVRVKVAMAGLCRTDIQAMRGERHLPNGRILGHEAAGWIEEIPPALSALAKSRGLSKGSIVAFFPFLPCGKCPSCAERGPVEECHAPSAIGLDEDGAFAPYVDLPLEVLFFAPPNLSFRHLAYAEPVSAAMAVATVPALLGAERVGVAGTGRIAQLTLAALDAHRVHPAEHLDPAQPWKPGSFDAIVETRATEEIIGRAVQALRPGGTLVVKSRPAAPVPWPHQDIVLRRIQVIGAPYGSFQSGLGAMASGKLNVDHMLGPVFPLNQEGIESALHLEGAGDETHGKLFFEISQ